MGCHMSLLSKVLCLVVCILLLGCGSAPERRNAMSAQALKHSERAARAYTQGELHRAAVEYEQALRGAQAIEDATAIAVARINLARVWRNLSRYDLSHQQLAALFSAPQLVYPPTSLSAAAVMQAQLYMEQGEMTSAEDWLAHGETLCASGCEFKASLQLLRAQLAMRDHHLDEANKLVDDAIAALKSPAQSIELANALRLSGELAYAANDEARAIVRFEQALALDQKLGLPIKIRLDLGRLAQTSARAGKATEAESYAARADAVGRASGALPESTSASAP